MDEKLARGFARRLFNGLGEEKRTQALAACFEEIEAVHSSRATKQKVEAAFKRFCARAKLLPDIIPVASFSRGNVVRTNYYVFLSLTARRDTYIYSKELKGDDDQYHFDINLVASQKKRTRWLSRSLPFFVTSHSVARLLQRTPSAKDAGNFISLVPQLAIYSWLWSIVLLARPYKNLPIVTPAGDGVFLGRSCPIRSERAQTLVSFGANGIDVQTGYDDLRQAIAEVADGSPDAPTPAIDYRTFISFNEMSSRQEGALEELNKAIACQWGAASAMAWQTMLGSTDLDFEFPVPTEDQQAALLSILGSLRNFLDVDVVDCFSGSELLPVSQYEPTFG